MPYYAVAHGRNVGIYQTWDECKAQTDHFSGPRFKKFKTELEAKDFIENYKITDGKSSVVGAGSISNSSNVNSILTPSLKTVLTQVPQNKSDCRFYSKECQGKFVGKKRVLQKEFDDDGSVIVYTDGACTENGRKYASAGIGVFWADNDPDNISVPLSGRPTNNRAEIHAAIMAIRKAKQLGHNKVLIRTDSQFLINSATKWVNGWMKKDWKLSTGEPVKNEIDFKELIEVMKNMEQVKWQKVSGHRGIYGNEKADQLARNAVPNPLPPTKRLKRF